MRTLYQDRRDRYSFGIDIRHLPVVAWLVVLTLSLMAPASEAIDHPDESQLAPVLVADSSWEELSKVTAGVADLLPESSEGTRAPSDRPSATEAVRRFVAAYALMAQNRSSPAARLLAASSAPDVIAAWLDWTQAALEAYPSSGRLRVLRADALARGFEPDEALDLLGSIRWGDEDDPRDGALAHYLAAQIHLSKDLSDEIGSGPASQEFHQSQTLYRLSAVLADFGFYYLSTGHLLPERARKYFESALALERDCRLAQAGLARLSGDVERFRGSLGVINLQIGATWRPDDPKVSIFRPSEIRANADISLFGGVYSVGDENIDLTSPLPNVLSTLVLPRSHEPEAAGTDR